MIISLFSCTGTHTTQTEPQIQIHLKQNLNINVNIVLKGQHSNLHIMSVQHAAYHNFWFDLTHLIQPSLPKHKTHTTYNGPFRDTASIFSHENYPCAKVHIVYFYSCTFHTQVIQSVVFVLLLNNKYNNFNQESWLNSHNSFLKACMIPLVIYVLNTVQFMLVHNEV